MAPVVDGVVLAGTLLAFLFGLGLGAHALDELHGRPLRTSLGPRTLLALGIAGMAGAMAVAVAGVFAISSWVIAWAIAGIALAIGYAFERPRPLHTPLGFGLAWGAFPTLVGYWAQAQTIGSGALLMAAATTLLSMTQRALSTPARNLRRTVDFAEMVLERRDATERWTEGEILETWEVPLKLLTAAVITFALGLLAVRVL
ncbi:MAG TPA: hypothetical protein VJQ57_15450 [Acidimicrobiia bacterium]|nr:hypothetical protein [Acidimicrobiia bacterium]